MQDNHPIADIVGNNEAVSRTGVQKMRHQFKYTFFFIVLPMFVVLGCEMDWDAVSDTTVHSTVGDEDFCSSEYPCDVGEGDCDGATEQCKPGLTCVHNVGATYGWGADVDVCEATCHGSAPGTSSYCSEDCPCGEGEGDCDGTTEQCAPGLTCVHNVGDEYGWDPDVDVCEATCHVSRPGSRNFCHESCLCEEGEGDCDGTTEQCAPGLTCVHNVGASYGWDADIDVCEAISSSPPSTEGIDIDGLGGLDPLITDCDMDNDGGGWILISEYDVGSRSFVVDYWDYVSNFFETVFSDMEIRHEVHMNTGRVYKQYNQVNAIKGANYQGRDVWFGSCKTRYTDTYQGDDWITQYDGSFPRCSFHVCASNDPQNYWQNNVVDECHRTMRADDGNRFIAQSNTYYAGWQAYCGGVMMSPSSGMFAHGCAVSHSYQVIGPEGLAPNPPGWYGYWRAMGGQVTRKIFVRSDSFYGSCRQQ